MTIRELKKIISNLPEEALLQVDFREVNEVKSITVCYSVDGRVRLILSTLE